MEEYIIDDKELWRPKGLFFGVSQQSLKFLTCILKDSQKENSRPGFVYHDAPEKAMERLNPQLIIFDWDDVITLGARDGYFACYDFALDRVGVTLPENIKTERILSKWGTNHHEELAELLQEHPEKLAEATEAFEQGFFGDVFVDSLHMVDGTASTLTRLAKRYKLAVATGGHPVLLRERIIPRFSIPPVFEMILSGYELPDPSKSKPDPYMLNVIMDKLRVGRSATIYVGDAENDVRMARSAKVEPVVVLSGHLSQTRAVELGVDYIIPAIASLEEILEY